MKADVFFDALELLDESYKQEAMTASGRRRGAVRLRALARTALIAAAIACLFIVGVYAAGSLINSPEQAKAAFVRELETMKDMGLLSDELSTDLHIYRCLEDGPHSDPFFPLRVFHQRYHIGATSEKDNGRRGWWIHGTVEMADGKLSNLNIQAFADENDEVTREYDGYKFYENYDDIFDVDLTVGEYCDLLADYWGFSGWTLGHFADGAYDEKYLAPTAETLVKDIPSMNGNYYLPVYFDGDENGAPMYIELTQFPDSVMLSVGTSHALG